MIETIFFQIREVPNDFFVDIVSSNNFLVTILNQLFGFVRNNATVDAALRSRMEKFQVKGHAKTALTRFWPFLTTFLPLVDIFEGISCNLCSKMYPSLTFPLVPTYLLLST